MKKYNVSICTAVRNRDLSPVIDTLSKQSLNKKLYEVVIVDWGSDKKINLDTCNFNCTYVYIYDKSNWSEFGRNVAVANSKGQLVCTVHADLLFSYNFVECLNEYYDNKGVIINVPRCDVPEVCRKYVNLPLRDNYFEQKRFISINDFMPNENRPINPQPLESCNIFQDIFDKYTVPNVKCIGDCQAMTFDNYSYLSGYDERLRGTVKADIDLRDRAIAMGIQPVFELSSAIVHLYHPGNYDLTMSQNRINRKIIKNRKPNTIKPNENFGSLTGPRYEITTKEV